MYHKFISRKMLDFKALRNVNAIRSCRSVRGTVFQFKTLRKFGTVVLSVADTAITDINRFALRSHNNTAAVSNHKMPFYADINFTKSHLYMAQVMHYDGPVAQLVECSFRIREVPGSKPGRSNHINFFQ